MDPLRRGWSLLIPLPRQKERCDSAALVGLLPGSAKKKFRSGFSVAAITWGYSALIISNPENAIAHHSVKFSDKISTKLFSTRIGTA
jgi:hypothetical protein